jgi:glyoxylase-like metal-dependent hydrolase (beta-lactamase superfamily II)
VRYNGGGEAWCGFERVTPLQGLPPEILLVPMHGHSTGHCGVAVDTPAGWLLHAGDAYYRRGELRGESRWRYPGLALSQGLVQVDRRAARTNLARLRSLAAGRLPGVRIFCSHDPAELSAAAPDDDRAHACPHA